MLEKVLSIRRTILHPSDEFDKFNIEAVYAKVDASALSCLQNLVFKLFTNLINHFLNTCRMYTSIYYKLM